LEEEKLLINKVLDGDIDSFSVIVYRYQDRLYRFLLGLTFCREDAEEILQDVFIRVYNYLHRYNSKWSLSTWIHKIAVNSFNDHYKRKKKSDFIEYYGDFAIYDVKHGNSIELNYESKELYKEVTEIIDRLKRDYRVSIVLKCVQGFTYEEIGQILGISSVNAKIRVNRARQEIFKELKGKRGG
jgi:RNA polymerase sigma-70 factor (ECF subfamily)